MSTHTSIPLLLTVLLQRQIRQIRQMQLNAADEIHHLWTKLTRECGFLGEGGESLVGKCALYAVIRYNIGVHVLGYICLCYFIIHCFILYDFFVNFFYVFFVLTFLTASQLFYLIIVFL